MRRLLAEWPPAMGWGSFAIGFAVLAGLLASCAGIAVLVVRGALGHLRGLPRAVALFVIFEAALLAVHLVPAALGVLSRWAVVLTGAATLAAVAALVRSRSAAVPDPEPARPSPASPPWSWALAAGSWAVVLGYLAVYLNVHVGVAVRHVDLLTFHLPDVASWMHDRSIWHHDEFVPLFSSGTYPQNGDVSFLAVMLPFEQDALVRLVPYPYLLATGVAVAAIARELRAPLSTAWLTAAVVVAAPVVLRPAVVASMPDAVLLSSFAAGVLFLARHARTGRRGELLLGAAALGIALGSKWYGLTTVGIAFAVWVGALLVAGRRPSTVARDAAPAAALIALFGGVWLVRNLVVTGNPLFPVRVPGLLHAPRDVIRERYGYTVADYATSASGWTGHLLPDWWSAFSLAGPLLLAGALAAAVSARRGRRVALAAAVPLMALAYAKTPYTALGTEGRPLLIAQNARYVVPALLLAAPLAAWWIGRLRGMRVLAEAAAAMCVPLALAQSERVPANRLAAAVVVLLGLAALVAWVRERGTPPVPRGALALVARPSRTLGALAVLPALLVAALAVRAVQDRQMPARYAHLDPSLTWLARHVPSGAHVGLAGGWTVEGAAPVYPAFGPRLGNRVSYVGRLDHGMLQPHRDRRAFAAALRRERYDVLLVGRLGPAAAWARAAGWKVAARDGRLVVMLPHAASRART